MEKLHNVHVESRWYHPVTMMCYRNNDGVWEFCKNKRYFKRDFWEQSGMNTGFKLINTLF